MCGTTVAKVKLKSKIHIQLRYGDISGKLHTSGQSEKGCKVNKSSSRMNFSGFDTKNIKQVWSGRQKCPSGNWSSKYPSTKHLLAGRSHLGWRASMVLVPDSHQSTCLKFCITFSHHDSRWSKGPIVGCLTLLSSAKSVAWDFGFQHKDILSWEGLGALGECVDPTVERAPKFYSNLLTLWSAYGHIPKIRSSQS